MATVRDEAICVRHWDWSETSQTVSLLTREHGLVRGLAKGSRREKGAFSGGIELLTLGEVFALSKPRTELLTLTAWDLRDPHTGLRHDLRAFHAGMYLADLVLGLISDHDPHPAAFEALALSLAGLAGLAQGSGSALGIVLGAQWAILSETGMKPELDADVRTGGSLAGDGVFAFVPGHGGFTRDGDAGWRVRGETLVLLRQVRAGGVLSDGPGGASVERAVRLLAAYVEHQTGRPFETLAPLLRSVQGRGARD